MRKYRWNVPFVDVWPNTVLVRVRKPLLSPLLYLAKRPQTAHFNDISLSRQIWKMLTLGTTLNFYLWRVMTESYYPCMYSNVEQRWLRRIHVGLHTQWCFSDNDPWLYLAHSVRALGLPFWCHALALSETLSCCPFKQHMIPTVEVEPYQS